MPFVGLWGGLVSVINYVSNRILALDRALMAQIKVLVGKALLGCRDGVVLNGERHH